jgi:Ca2+-binding RTX toxin-like protein
MARSGSLALTAGTGRDTFAFAADFGHDQITDFRPTGASADVIEFSTDVFSSFAEVQAAMQQVGADVVISVDAANSLTLRSVSLASLTPDDFLFV